QLTSANLNLALAPFPAHGSLPTLSLSWAQPPAVLQDSSSTTRSARKMTCHSQFTTERVWAVGNGRRPPDRGDVSAHSRALSRTSVKRARTWRVRSPDLI